MNIKNTNKSYGKVAKLFHWLMALLFVGMFLIAYVMTNISKSSFRFSLYDMHKATGMLLFALVALRLFWRFMNDQPTLSGSVPRWQHWAAKSNVIFLYVLMFLMPISGFLTSTLGGHDITFYHLFTIAPLANNASLSEFYANAHELLSYLLIATFSLHVLGAFYHHYFMRDDVLRRMWV